MKIGIKGISYSATERKYLVRVVRNAKRVYLGRYSSLEEAKQALAQEETNDTPEELPILSLLRAEFAPKNSKTTKKLRSGPSNSNAVLGNKTTHVPSKVSSSKSKKLKKPKALSKALTGEVAGTLTITGPTAAEYRKSTGEQMLEFILTHLLELAKERKTSVFDVIVQEVARLSKK